MNTNTDTTKENEVLTDTKQDEKVITGKIVKQTKDIPATKDEILCICVEDLTLSLSKKDGLKRYKSGERIYLDRKLAEKLYTQNLIKYA